MLDIPASNNGRRNVTPANIRAQAATMIRFLAQRLHAGRLSEQEYIVSVGEVERWALQALAQAEGIVTGGSVTSGDTNRRHPTHTRGG